MLIFIAAYRKVTLEPPIEKGFLLLLTGMLWVRCWGQLVYIDHSHAQSGRVIRTHSGEAYDQHVMQQLG